MVIYFSAMYQAIPALYELYKRTGGVIITTRISTFIKVKRNFPKADIRLVKNYLPNWWPSKKLLYQAKLIVTGAPYRSFLSQFQAKKAMVFHGTYALADSQELARLGHFDFLFSFGKRMTEYLTQGGYQKRIIDSAYLPFLGFNSLSNQEKGAVYKKLNLSPSRKTVVYMPMGKPLGSWDLIVEKLIKETPSEFNLILRPHPSYNTTINLLQTLKLIKLKLLCKKRPNTFLDKSNLSHSTIFNITDILICDGASVPEEALFYKMPIIFVETSLVSRDRLRDLMIKKKLNNTYIEKLLSIYDCGTSMPINGSIKFHIEKALAGKKLKAQKEYFNWVFNDSSNERQTKVINFIQSYQQLI